MPAIELLHLPKKKFLLIVETQISETIMVRELKLFKNA